MLIEGPPGPEGPAVSIDSHSLIYFQQSYTCLPETSKLCHITQIIHLRSLLDYYPAVFTSLY